MRMSVAMKHKKKILVLCYYKFPCNHPVIENVFAKEMGKRKDVFFIFSSTSVASHFIKWHNSKVILVKAFNSLFIFNKLISKLNFLFKVYRWNQREGFDIILIRDMPALVLLILPLVHLKKVRLYYQHSAPQGDFNLAYSKISSGQKKLFFFCKGKSYNFFLKYAFRVVDIVFPISECQKHELKKEIKNVKFVPLTMGVDEDWIKKTYKKICKPPQKSFVLTYFGSIDPLRKPKFIINAFKLVTNKNINCKLLLIGKASSKNYEEEIIRYSKQLGLEDRVEFTGFVDKHELKRVLSISDLSISAIPPTKYYKLSSPTKIYESLALGLPVVANRGLLEQEKVVAESKGGVIANYHPKAFSDKIIWLLENPDVRSKMSECGKQYVKDNYTYSLIYEKIAPYF